MSISQEELDELWDFSDPALSLQRFTSAASTRSGRDAAILRSQALRALGLAGKFAEARSLGAGLLAAINDDDAALISRLNLELGRVENSSGGDGLPYFERAVEFAKKTSATERSEEAIFLLIDALHMIGIAAPERAEAVTAQALELAKQGNKRTQRWRVSLWNNLGWTRLDAGNKAGAKEAFEQALAAAREVGTEQQVEWALVALGEI